MKRSLDCYGTNNTFDAKQTLRSIKVNKNVQEEPETEAAANPDTRRKRKSDTDVHS